MGLISSSSHFVVGMLERSSALCAGRKIERYMVRGDYSKQVG